MSLVSVVIPSRNEPYLKKTIIDLLDKSTGDIEIIAFLDGYWPPAEEMVINPQVSYIHWGYSSGMRNAINSAVAIARGDYILKTDAHCMFSKGFDEVLKADCQDNWILVPTRKRLNPKSWKLIIDKRTDIDYMYLTSDLHGMEWRERNVDPRLKQDKIVDLMSAQGSCWFMKKDYFHYLELLDEKSYGMFWQEFQEIGLKCWLSGGAVKRDKNCWYAHWHKIKEFGRGYHLPKEDRDKAIEFTRKWLVEEVWHKQRFDINYLVAKFAPVPTWSMK